MNEEQNYWVIMSNYRIKPTALVFVNLSIKQTFKWPIALSFNRYVKDLPLSQKV